MGKQLEDEDIIFLKYQLKPICAPLSGDVLILNLIIKGSQQRSSNKQTKPFVRGRDLLEKTHESQLCTLLPEKQNINSSKNRYVLKQ